MPKQTQGVRWPYMMQEGSQQLLAKMMSPEQKDITRIGYGGPKGGGKASRNSSLVLTPFGFRKMGDIKVGDRICDTEGSVQRVLAVHPQGPQDIYRVSFTTGAETFVTLDHLWLASISANSRKRKGRKVTLMEKFTTAQLKEHLEKNATQKQSRWPLIPLPAPVQFTKANTRKLRSIPAYLIGLLLGDGCITGSANPSITTQDMEIVEYVAAYCEDEGYECTILNKENHYAIYIKGVSFSNKLKKLRLWGTYSSTKFIPEVYKYSSAAERIALVQGLMDTDGYVDDRGHMSYTSVSPVLAKDFQWVIRSLGGKAAIWEKDTFYRDAEGEKVSGLLAYNVQFNTAINPDLLTLPRKKDRCRDFFNGGISELKLRMESITFSHREEATCITVSNANSLYITDDFIVTHNSYGARGLAFTLTYNLPIQVCLVRSRLKVLYRNHINPAKNELRYFMESKLLSYNDNQKMFQWNHTRGAVMFAHMERESDADQFDGLGCDLYIFEEGGHFTQSMIQGVTKNCRPSDLAISAGIKYMPRTLTTFNWGGKGHSYNRRIFWDRIYEGLERPEDYAFIFASMYENKAMLEADGGRYEQTLKELPEALMKAYLLGDPNAFIGAMFTIVDEVHQVDAGYLLREHGGLIPKSWRIVGSLDAAAGGGTCSFGLYCVSPAGKRYKIYTYYASRQNPMEHRDAICDIIESPHSPVYRFTKGRKPDYIVADRFAFQNQDRIGLLNRRYTFEGLFNERGHYLWPVNFGRVTAMMALQTALHFEYEDGVLDLEPELQFFKDYNNPTLKELREAERDQKNPDDIAHGPDVADHAIDETKNFLLAISDPPEVHELKMAERNPHQYGMDQESSWLKRDRNYENTLSIMGGSIE